MRMDVKRHLGIEHLFEQYTYSFLDPGWLWLCNFLVVAMAMGPVCFVLYRYECLVMKYSGKVYMWVQCQ